MWLLRVARYIDQSNIMEVFDAPVVDEPALTRHSTSIQKLHVGRVKATKYFFRLPDLKKNRKIWDSLRSLTESYRSYLSQRLMIEVLTRELQQANEREAEMGNNLDDQISKIAFTYTSVEHPSIRPDHIIKGKEHSDPTVREKVDTNCNLIKYIFCTDSVLDHNDPRAEAVTRQSLELEVGHDLPVIPPNLLETPSGINSGKQSPTKMDSERRRS